MGTKSKLFRVFVEGETISDGRKITAEMIDECVATFDLGTYTPRINIEHIAGYSPEPPFNGYGDVVALEARTDDFTIAGAVEKRRALYAQVDANDQLVSLAGKDQKPFPSVELTPSYAGTGKFGVVGLAFTDTPASIGTQRLKFSHRVPGTLFVSATEAPAIEFEVAAVDKVNGAIAGFFSALTARFTSAASTPPKEEPKAPANDNFDVAAFTTAIGETVGQSIAAAVAPVTAELATIKSDYAALKGKLESTEAPSGFSRQPAPGGSNAIVTDC